MILCKDDGCIQAISQAFNVALGSLFGHFKLPGKMGCVRKKLLPQATIKPAKAFKLREYGHEIHLYAVWVDRDEKREILTLHVTDRGRTSHPARGLSDGTLRFLALAVLELDPESKGLLCLEEPENGIHPQRIPAMLRLLEDIAVDTNSPIGTDNPLRQLTINTHSPAVVAQVHEDCLLVAEPKEDIHLGRRRFNKVRFSCLSDTWRVRVPGYPSIVSRGKLLSYLNPIGPEESEDTTTSVIARKTSKSTASKNRRVADREDFRQLRLPFVGSGEE